MKDMEVEDDALKLLIEKSRLAQWYEKALHQARQDFEANLREETEDGASSIEAARRLQDIEKSIKEKGQEDALSRLHTGKPGYQQKKANGSVGKFRSSITQY